MPTFRTDLATGDNRPISPPIVRELCALLMQRANYFVADPLRLAWEHRPDEEVFWELFHGRALDAAQTRQRCRFEAWNVYVVEADGEQSAEPILSLKYDPPASRVHVTRAVLCHAHEGYDAGGNVIETREVRKWQRELVGTIALTELVDAGALHDELACRLFQAVVGASRLPLTSVEAPLPAFTLGQFGYIHRPAEARAGGDFMSDVGQLVGELDDPSLARDERIKLWELILRACPAAELPNLAKRLGGDGADVRALYRGLFNAISLSPYTDFVAKSLALIRYWAENHGPGERASILADLIRLVGRHLAAYDLITFHHGGVNYPDALLLGELLAELGPLTERQPELFAASPALRRAVRLGLILVAEYAGHPVPDVPTSPGENLRVLPAPFARVPDDQIYSPITRQRHLFADGIPHFNEEVVRDCFRDLDDPTELQPLGMALYLDRPLGFAKAPGEPDQTLLTSHLLFSRSIADVRLARLACQADWLTDGGAVDRWRAQLRALTVSGLPLTERGASARPGVVSLHDASRLADDWILLRTTRKTLHDFAEQFDLQPLAKRFGDLLAPWESWRLLVPGGTESQPTLCVFDSELRLRLEMAADLTHGYGTRGGIEFPARGLGVLRAWNVENPDQPIDLRGDDLILPPRR